MTFLAVVKSILEHPLNRSGRMAALVRFFKWQIFSRLMRSPVVLPFVGKSVLVVQTGMTGATGNVYNGLHEHNEMLCLLHVLRPGDFFVDVGANIGSYTILASVNCQAHVVSFEPVPTTFQFLKRNVLINDVFENVRLLQAGVASKEEKLFFSADLDAANHIVAADEQNIASMVEVPCLTLDGTLTQVPLMMKIDVEGFETEVLRGASRILRSPHLKCIIIELNGSGERYGYNDQDIHDLLVGYDFFLVSYDPFKREFHREVNWGRHNSIYVRDLSFITDRVRAARAIFINNLSI